MANRSSAHITVDNYERMIAAGLLTEDDKVELIEGVIVEMEPIGTEHAGCIAVLNHLLGRRVPEDVRIHVQSPVAMMPDSLPEPDVALIRARPHDYRRVRPQPSDLLLIIEVCDSSFQMDLLRKVPLYARSAVPEVWLVDLNGDRLLRFREPSGSAWRHTDILERGASLAPAACPAAVLTMDEILGPAD